jgi:hypothetical protein
MVGSISFESDGVTGWTSGMNDDERIDMSRYFEEKYKGKQCYIQGQEVTRMGALRHPRYLGMVK